MEKCKHKDGCDNKVYAKGWCSGHYARFIRTGDAGSVSLERPVAKKKGVCSHPSGECKKKEFSKGLCSMHYKRVKYKGDIGPVHTTQKNWAGKICKVDGCYRKVKTVGYCGMHYLRFLNTGNAGQAEPMQLPQPEHCEVEGCNRKARTKNMCDMHYQRYLKHGDAGQAEALALHKKFATWGEGEKKCTICKTVKSIDNFQQQKRSRDGKQSCCRACMRILNFSQKFNFEEGEVRQILKEQTICQICESKDDLVIDHCHEKNEIRGILCRKCNTGLGQFNDRVDIMKKAIEYIKKHKDTTATAS